MKAGYRKSRLPLALHQFADGATAQIKIGVDLAVTCPAAAIEASSKNAVLLWPQQIAGQRVEYILLRDGSDPSNAVRNAHKLIS